MLRQITIIVSLILLNIILLASIIIPHHHHRDEICIVATHCHSDEDSHENDLSSHEHEHDNSGHCNLNSTFIISKSDQKQECYSIELRDSNFSGTIIFFRSENILTTVATSFQHPPEVNSSYNATISQNKGLRGPPTL